MKISAFVIPVVFCFLFPNIQNMNTYTAQLNNCIKRTTDHYREMVLASGGSSSDRLYYSRTQIRELCVASQTTVRTIEPTTEIVTTVSSSTHQSVSTTDSLSSIIDLLQDLESYRLMLST
jgi:hypothetical protein